MTRMCCQLLRLLGLLECRQKWRLCLWIVTALAPFITVAMAAADDRDRIFFHDDYNKAIQEAKLTKKPIFLEFRCAP